MTIELFQPRAHVVGRQQVLRLFDRDFQIRGDHVGEAGGLAHLHRHHLQFVGQIGHQRHELGKLAHQMSLQRVEFLIALDRLAQAPHVGAEVRLELDEIEQVDSRDALHQHPHAMVGILEHLENPHRGAAREQSFGRRILLFGILLRREPDYARSLADVLDQSERRRTRNQEGMNLVRENHDAAQRQHRQHVRHFDLA